MSTQTTEASTNVIDENINENQIAEYLKTHPDFFQRHIELLEHLKVPHVEGTAVSLIERQVSLLREQKNTLDDQLKNLIHAARNNEQIVTRMQRFTLEMLHSDTLDDVVASCQNLLRSDFNADYAVIKLIGKNKDNGSYFIKPNDTAIKHFAHLFEKNKPVCGRITTNQSTFVFGDHHKSIQSSVLIPLQNTKNLGIIALGSKDESRFHPDMGTLFLSYLGELVTATLTKHIHN